MEFTWDYYCFPLFSVLISNPKKKKIKGRILHQEVVGSFTGLCCRVSEALKKIQIGRFTSKFDRVQKVS